MEQVVELFKNFDETGKGTISRSMLTDVLVRLNPERYDGKALDQLFGEDSNSVIDFKRFIAWACGANPSPKDFVLGTEASIVEEDAMENAEEVIENAEEIIEKAKMKFKELDKNSNGTLCYKELEGLVAWIFSEFGRTFKSEKQKRQQVEKQIDRFKKKGENKEWTWDQFKEYYVKLLDDSAKYQAKRNEAYAKGYNKSEAAKMFQSLDKDDSKYLDGQELESFAEWLIGQFKIDDKPMSEEQKKSEAKKLLYRLDERKGNNDTKLSFAEFDFYFDEKLQQVDKFKKRQAEIAEKKALKAAEIAEKKKIAEADKTNGKDKPEEEAKPAEESMTAQETKQVEEAKPAEDAKPVDNAKPAEEAKLADNAKDGEA